MTINFEWDEEKNIRNFLKHHVSFFEAQKAFLDNKRIIAKDIEHSSPKETRYFCFGKIKDEILTVRFTYRAQTIRIIGAGYWRKGKKIYDKAQN